MANIKSKKSQKTKYPSQAQFTPDEYAIIKKFLYSRRLKMIDTLRQLKEDMGDDMTTWDVRQHEYFRWALAIIEWLVTTAGRSSGR